MDLKYKETFKHLKDKCKHLKYKVNFKYNLKYKVSYSIKKEIFSIVRILTWHFNSILVITMTSKSVCVRLWWDPISEGA